jgi:DNA topoisomerase-2
MISANYDLSQYDLLSIDEISVIDKEITTYDFTVQDDHTFYVRHKSSSDYILTHNCDGVHITGLLINLFNTFWPELFKLGFVCKFKTPIVKVTVGKEVIDFYTEEDFKAWSKKTNKKYTSKYFKGLGTSTSKEFKEYMEKFDESIIPYSIEDTQDKEAVKLAFSKEEGKVSTNKRKDWLSLLEI